MLSTTNTLRPTFEKGTPTVFGFLESRKRKKSKGKLPKLEKGTPESDDSPGPFRLRGTPELVSPTQSEVDSPGPFKLRGNISTPEARELMLKTEQWGRGSGFDGPLSAKIRMQDQTGPILAMSPQQLTRFSLGRIGITTIRSTQPEKN